MPTPPNDSGGARIQGACPPSTGYGGIFRSHVVRARPAPDGAGGAVPSRRGAASLVGSAPTGRHPTGSHTALPAWSPPGCPMWTLSRVVSR